MRQPGEAPIRRDASANPASLLIRVARPSPQPSPRGTGKRELVLAPAGPTRTIRTAAVPSVSG